MGCGCGSSTGKCKDSYRKRINNLKSKIKTLKVLNPEGSEDYNDYLQTLSYSQTCPPKTVFNAIKDKIDYEYAKYS